MPNRFFLRLFSAVVPAEKCRRRPKEKRGAGGFGGRRGKGKHAARVTGEMLPENIARRIRPFARPPALVMPSPLAPFADQKKTPADTRQGPSKVIDEEKMKSALPD